MPNSDPIDVVRQEHAKLAKENHRQKLLTLSSSGRHVILSYPQDMTDDELLDFGAWLLNGFREQLPGAAPKILPVHGVIHD